MPPFRKKKVVDNVEQYQSDILTDILYLNTSEVKWVPYYKHHGGNYARVHYDPTSDCMVLRIDTEKDSYTQATQIQWRMDKLDLTKTVFEEQQAHFAGANHRTLKGLRPSINPDSPPNLKNYIVTRSCYFKQIQRDDSQKLGEALTKEYLLRYS
jgi:hypothetical protein